MTRISSLTLLLAALGHLNFSSAQKMLSMDFVKKYSESPRSLARRASGTYNVEYYQDNLFAYYLANTTIGTPGQPLVVQIDTGSSDIVVPAALSFCKKNNCTGGSFDSSKSSTYKRDKAQGVFNASYAIGSASGSYMLDTLSIGGATVENVTMGLVTAGSGFDGHGILGVGLPVAEAGFNTTSTGIYENFPVLLKQQGLINKVCYSVWLNSVDSASGTFLFGGIDKDKYAGELISLPLVPDFQAVQMGVRVRDLAVPLSSISVTKNNVTTQITPAGIAPFAAVLDTGSTYTSLPDDLATAILHAVGASLITFNGMQIPIIPCRYASEEAYVEFRFGGPNGPVIKALLGQMMRGIAGYTYESGDEGCIFGIKGNGGSKNPVILGDSFMRNAYVFYDLEELQIALAPAKFKVDSSNIIAVSSGANSLITTTATITGPAIFSGFVSNVPFTGESGDNAFTIDSKATAGIGNAAGTASIYTGPIQSYTATGTASTSSSVAFMGASPPSVQHSTIAVMLITVAGMLLGGTFLCYL